MDEGDEQQQFDRLVETVCAAESGDSQSNHDRDDTITLDTSRDAEQSFMTDDCDDELILSFDKGINFLLIVHFRLS